MPILCALAASERLKSGRKGYIESHSALRGIASAVVVIDHLRAFQLVPMGGAVGRIFCLTAWSNVAVFLFFLLSGFVMGHVYPSPVKWRHFFIARGARLLPVYEVSLIVLIGMMLAAHQTDLLRPSNVVANLLMIHQWLPVPGWETINLPSWSLSVELLLYLAAFPLLIATRHLPGRRVLYFILVFAGAVWGVLFYNYLRDQLFQVWEYPLLCGLFGFSAGFAAEALMEEKNLRYPGWAGAIGASLIVTGILHPVVFPNSLQHEFLALGLVALLVASVDPDRMPYRLLARPFLLYLGDISYSLYLWHFPVMELVIHLVGRVETHLHSSFAHGACHVAIPVMAVLLSFAVATASYYRLEVPARRLIRDRFVRARAGALLP